MISQSAWPAACTVHSAAVFRPGVCAADVFCAAAGVFSLTGVCRSGYSDAGTRQLLKRTALLPASVVKLHPSLGMW